MKFENIKNMSVNRHDRLQVKSLAREMSLQALVYLEELDDELFDDLFRAFVGYAAKRLANVGHPVPVCRLVEERLRNRLSQRDAAREVSEFAKKHWDAEVRRQQFSEEDIRRLEVSKPENMQKERMAALQAYFGSDTNLLENVPLD